jgi:hypothetical protein
MINTTPHVAWYLKGILENVQFWRKERRKRVRGFKMIPGQDEPPKLHSCMKLSKCA